MFKINKLTSSNISELIFELIESNSYSLSTYSLLIISIICLVKEEVSSLFCSLIIEPYLLRTKLIASSPNFLFILLILEIFILLSFELSTSNF